METITPTVLPRVRLHRSIPQSAIRARALALWPRLDRRALARCADDPARIARLISRRTMLPTEAILEILCGGVTDTDRELWFG